MVTFSGSRKCIQAVQNGYAVQRGTCTTSKTNSLGYKFGCKSSQCSVLGYCARRVKIHVSPAPYNQALRGYPDEHRTWP